MSRERWDVAEAMERRQFLRAAAAGTLVVALGGGTYVLAAEDDPRANEIRPDGRKRLPPGQRIIDALKPMGGEAGDPSPSAFRLDVHGDVDAPFSLTFDELTKMTVVDQVADVHCVTGWSMLGATWTGVRVSELAARAKVRTTARHVIFEAAHGYTANVPLKEALAPSVMVTYRHQGQPLGPAQRRPLRLPHRVSRGRFFSFEIRTSGTVLHSPPQR